MNEQGKGTQTSEAEAKQAKKTWRLWPRNKTEWFFSVAGLLLAILAIQPISDFLFKSSDEKLANLGYKYDEGALWSAIQNKHIEAVELFAAKGMSLKSYRLAHFMSDDVFNKEIGAYLVSEKMLSDRHCPTSLDNISLYTEHSNNTDKSDLIRKVCGVPIVLSALRAKSAELAAINKEATKLMSGFSERVDACVSRYKTEDLDTIMDGAARMNLMGTRTYTERECVLARVHIQLVGASMPDEDPAQWVDEAASDCCQRYVDQASIDASSIESIDAALEALK